MVIDKVTSSVPSKEILHCANVCFIAYEAHATAQPCRHTTSEAFPTLKGLCDVCIYCIKFSMLEVHENEMALRKFSGGTAQLRTLEGTLVTSMITFSDCISLLSGCKLFPAKNQEVFQCFLDLLSAF